MQRLKDKVALITGGSSGIGLATARLFAAEGASVIITGRRQAELSAAVSLLGDAAVGIQGDTSRLADLDQTFAQIRERQGRIDILFANAGVGEFLPLGAITEQHFDAAFAVNVKGTLFTVQKALPLMPDGSCIVLTASIASVKGIPAFSVYSATKAAVRCFARGWAVD
jgi:NAD(P)-dependent dehydrogenase (short-subunit alcohol dehydrogenase family)